MTPAVKRTDKPIDPRFLDTVAAVEADSFAKLKLWEENHKQVRWEADTLGFIETVGKFGGMPVTVSCFWDKINGRRVLFYESPSQVVNWPMVREWLASQCPKDVEYWDAMNFHNALRHIESLNEKSPLHSDRFPTAGHYGHPGYCGDCKD